MTRLSCPVCGAQAVLAKWKKRDGSPRLVWRCSAGCDTAVGCHDGTTEPLGTLATKALRAKRNQTHAIFDRLWIRKRIGQRAGARADAYKWLAGQLGIGEEQCHIGLFDEAMCNRAIEACLTRKGFKL